MHMLIEYACVSLFICNYITGLTLELDPVTLELGPVTLNKRDTCCTCGAESHDLMTSSPHDLIISLT